MRYVHIPKGLIVLLCFSGLACKQRMSAHSLYQTYSGTYTYEQYTADCEKALGKIPKFSCVDGQVIPILNNISGPVTAENHLGRGQQCDSPTHIRSDTAAWTIGANHCVPGSRIGRLQPVTGFKDQTQIVFICRKYFPRNGSSYKDSSGKIKIEQTLIFDDVNVIAHNSKTGATCFFVNNINRNSPGWSGDNGFDGRQVP